MELTNFVIATFWISLALSSVVTPLMLRALQKMQLYRQYRKDRKKTLYGKAATEFNKIRKKEEKTTKKGPVSRVGGLVLLPTIILVSAGLIIHLSSDLLFICLLAILAVALIALYDDFVDIGIVRRRAFSIAKRLLLLGLVAIVIGYALSKQVPNHITLLPFEGFKEIPVGIFFPLIFAAWYLFWQLSSVIDGIDGLSGSIFFVLFIGTAALSILQNNTEALLLSVLAVATLTPWLFINFAPARAYLTEIGMTILIMFFALTTFLLATCQGAADGLWVGTIFGIVLIVTWVSNILQLLYRRKTGKKLFRIAPIHHHFEAIGIPGSAVVSRYMLITILCVIAGLSLVLLK